MKSLTAQASQFASVSVGGADHEHTSGRTELPQRLATRTCEHVPDGVQHASCSESNYALFWTDPVARDVASAREGARSQGIRGSPSHLRVCSRLPISHADARQRYRRARSLTCRDPAPGLPHIGKEILGRLADKLLCNLTDSFTHDVVPSADCEGHAVAFEFAVSVENDVRRRVVLKVADRRLRLVSGPAKTCSAIVQFGPLRTHSVFIASVPSPDKLVGKRLRRVSVPLELGAMRA